MWWQIQRQRHKAWSVQRLNDGIKIQALSAVWHHPKPDCFCLDCKWTSRTVRKDYIFMPCLVSNPGLYQLSHHLHPYPFNLWMITGCKYRCRDGDYVVTRCVCDTMTRLAAVRVWLKPSEPKLPHPEPQVPTLNSTPCSHSLFLLLGWKQNVLPASDVWHLVAKLVSLLQEFVKALGRVTLLAEAGRWGWVLQVMFTSGPSSRFPCPDLQGWECAALNVSATLPSSPGWADHTWM